jgi:cytochrome P450
LVAYPGLLPTAMEEFLRASAPVTMTRLVKRNMHRHGVDKGRRLGVAVVPGGQPRSGPVRTRREFAHRPACQPDAAFGLGVHGCVGSHLARMELRVALQVWLERIPVLTLDDPAAVTWTTGQVRGPRALTVRIRLSQMARRRAVAAADLGRL